MTSKSAALLGFLIMLFWGIIFTALAGIHLHLLLTHRATGPLGETWFGIIGFSLLGLPLLGICAVILARKLGARVEPLVIWVGEYSLPIVMSVFGCLFLLIAWGLLTADHTSGTVQLFYLALAVLFAIGGIGFVFMGLNAFRHPEYRSPQLLQREKSSFAIDVPAPTPVIYHTPVSIKLLFGSFGFLMAIIFGALCSLMWFPPLLLGKPIVMEVAVLIMRLGLFVLFVWLTAGSIRTFYQLIYSLLYPLPILCMDAAGFAVGDNYRNATTRLIPWQDVEAAETRIYSGLHGFSRWLEIRLRTGAKYTISAFDTPIGLEELLSKVNAFRAAAGTRF